MVATPSYDAVDLRKKHTRLVLVELTQLEEGAWRLSGNIQVSVMLVTALFSSWDGALCVF